MTLPEKQAIEVLVHLKKIGVKKIVLCPGGRNAPFVEVLSHSQCFEVVSYFEERSASFYALGLAKNSSAPVAVVTTSGTAVAEVLSAVIEGYYQQLPLVIISADRPKSYRGSGAPQAIEQSQLLSSHCHQVMDIESDLTPLEELHQVTGPVHINICFDEPLVSPDTSVLAQDLPEGLLTRAAATKAKEVTSLKIKEASCEKLFLQGIKSDGLNETLKKPLIILGALSGQEAEQVKNILTQIEAPIYAEAHSQLKSSVELTQKFINGDTSTLQDLFINKHCTSVVRIGGIPVHRFWRDLQKLKNIPVVNFSSLSFSGVPRVNRKPGLISELKQLLQLNIKCDLKSIHSAIHRSYVQPQASKEQQFIHLLSQQLEDDAHIFLGNSLPIREWDDFALIKPKQSFTTLRGANGIDGNLAYFLGNCKVDKPNYCIIGDLTALYDLSSGFIYNQILIEQSLNFKIVIINNGGGQIFNKLYANELYKNQHHLNFKGWADMLGLTYKKISNLNEFDHINAKIIELAVTEDS